MSNDRRTLLRRLADDDPELTSAWTRGDLRFTRALKGNTHLRELSSCVVFEQDENASEKEKIAWMRLALAAGRVHSLQKLEIDIKNDTNIAGMDHFQVVGLLLYFTRNQIKEIRLKTSGDVIVDNSEAFSRVLASSLADHPSLEIFRMETFDLSTEFLGSLCGSLETVSSLHTLVLDPRCDVDNDNMEWDVPMPADCDLYLGRIMHIESLHAITFRNINFDPTPSRGGGGGRAVEAAIASPTSKLRTISFENCHLHSMRSFIWSVMSSPSLQEVALYDVSFTDCNDQDANLWDPLGSNSVIKKLHLYWPHNKGLAWPHLSSLCRALRSNSTMEILHLHDPGLRYEDCNTLAEMISDNTGLTELTLSALMFGSRGCSTLLTGLNKNRSLRALHIWGGMDTFARHCLGETDDKPILTAAAQSYHLEHLVFEEYPGLDTFLTLNSAIAAITKLNKAGRRYLVETDKGPECKAAGVKVLSKVSDDLDCLFFHLRENPLLCDRAGVGEKETTLAKSQLS